MVGFNWTCPFCHKPQIVTENNYSRNYHGLYVGESKYGNVGYTHIAFACLNEECKEITLKLLFTKRKLNGNNGSSQGDLIQAYNLRPESNAKIFPECVPEPLRQDYLEACSIAALSPKASATLSRRCIQGAIRDFCGISKHRLIDEIKALKEAVENGTAPSGVTHESVEAIDYVRQIGNIGAHMEKDINVIVDVDEGEAQSLTDLIELLFDEWYLAREKRTALLNKIKGTSAEKAALRLALPSP